MGADLILGGIVSVTDTSLDEARLLDEVARIPANELKERTLSTWTWEVHMEDLVDYSHDQEDIDNPSDDVILEFVKHQALNFLTMWNTSRDTSILHLPGPKGPILIWLAGGTSWGDSFPELDTLEFAWEVFPEALGRVGFFVGGETRAF